MEHQHERGRMVMNSAFLLSRIAFAALMALVSVFAILSYVPFTYVSVIHRPIFPFVGYLADNFWWMYIVALASVVAVSAARWRKSDSRSLILLFVAVQAGIAVVLPFSPSLTALPNDERSLVYAAAALFLPVWLSAIDLYHLRTSYTPSSQSAGVLGLRAIIAASTVAALFSMWEKVTTGAWPLLVRSSLAHLTLFALAGSVLVVTGAAASRVSSGMGRLLARLAGPGVLIALVFQKVLLRSIMLDGPAATGIACAFALMIVVLAAVICIEMQQSWLRNVDGASSRVWAVLALVIAAVVMLCIRIRLDWNGVFRGCAIVAGWCCLLGAAGILFRSRDHRQVSHSLACVAFTVAVIGLNAIVAPQLEKIPSSSIDAALRDNAAFGLAVDLSTVVRKTDVDARVANLLRAGSSLRATVSPDTVQLIPASPAQQGPKPHIFIVVVDSLRPDYLSPYNASVHFTPAIQAFAQESVVFTNAFTRYGGTFLAEPSIWSGTLVPHGEYPKPFTNMNTLAKLAAENGYESFLQGDLVAAAVVRFIHGEVPGEVQSGEGQGKTALAFLFGGERRHR